MALRGIFSQRAFSRLEQGVGLLLLGMLWVSPASSELALSVGNIETPVLRMTDLRLHVGDSKTVFRASRLSVAGHEFFDLQAECGRFSWQTDGFSCAEAFLTARGLKQKFPFALSRQKGILDIRLQPGAGEEWRLVRKPDESTELSVVNGRIESLKGFLPLPPDYQVKGRVDGRLHWTTAGISGRWSVREGGFSDKAGAHAAEKLAFDLRMEARRNGAAWSWEAQAGWQGGEIYWQPFYAKGHGQTVMARGRFDDQKIEVAEARLRIPEVGEIAGGGEWNRRERALLSARIESSGLDLARAGAMYLNPILMPFGVPETAYGGRLSFNLLWDREGLSSVDAGLENVSLREMRGRFSATGVNGGLPWRRTEKRLSTIRIAGAQAGPFKLGAFELPVQIEPQRFIVQKAEIPFLNSKLTVERLVWRKSNKRQAWEGDLSLSIAPVQLADLTAAFDLPKMSGTLSGTFPHLRYREKAAYLDGALVIEVFEGHLKCTHLRLEDPFGTVPQLTADIEAKHINLGQMTDAFSFGSITGYVDAEVKELELANWKPVKFDARIFSSEGDYRKRISQRAVQNISSLGGSGAGAALQATFLRFFDEFGYDKIGISCKLRGGVCEMGGVEKAPQGFILVRGGGLPALTVIGYNRRVDWTELVDRIRGAIAVNRAPVVK